MAFREIQQRPDKAVVECWLTEGAKFEDRLWDKNLIVHRVVKVEMELAHVNKRLELQVPMNIYLAGDPAHPNASWHIHAGLPVARRFDTPTGDLSPNEVSVSPTRVAWVDEQGLYNEDAPEQLTITRDGSNQVKSVTRKARG